MQSRGSGRSNTWLFPAAMTKRINAAASRIPPEEPMKILIHFVFIASFFKDEMFHRFGAFQFRRLADKAMRLARVGNELDYGPMIE